jgi:NAD(P)H-dependent FMN reductase
MRILAISGSLRTASSNGAVLQLAESVAPEGVTFAYYEGLADLPHFSPDLDVDPAPPAVQALRDQIREADALLICTPEYAYGVPGSLKNMLDWLVSSPEIIHKPIGPMSASPNHGGGEKAHWSLVQTLTAMSTNIVPEASIVIPFVRMKLADPGELREQLRAGVGALVAAVSPSS